MTRPAVDIDTALAGVLRAQRAQQAKERLAAYLYQEKRPYVHPPAGVPTIPSTSRGCSAATARSSVYPV